VDEADVAAAQEAMDNMLRRNDQELGMETGAVLERRAIDHCVNTLKSLHGDAVPGSGIQHLRYPQVPVVNVAISPVSAKALREGLINDPHHPEAGPDDAPVDARPHPVDDRGDDARAEGLHTAEHLLAPHGLNPGQVNSVTDVIDWFRSPRTSPAPLILIDGGPGTGKTHVSTALIQVLDKLDPRGAGVHVATVALCGNAASLLPNGRTMHSKFDVHIRAPDIPLSNLDEQRKKRLENRLNVSRTRDLRPSVLLIDEISMVPAALLAHVEHRCRQVFDKDKPWGGLCVVCVGDFWQLPPAVGMRLYQVALKGFKGTNQESDRAAQLFPHFQRKPLTQQMRAPDDPVHMDFIERCRTQDAPITMSDLGRIKQLSRRDVLDDPSWKFAPIATTGNKKRHAINMTMAMQWAVDHNVPIVKWKHKFATNIAPHQEEFYRKEFATYLEGIFVQGAPAMILNNDLNPARGLANGTQCFFHSLVLSASDDGDHVMQRIRDAQAGEVVWIDPPDSILVEVPNADIHTWPADLNAHPVDCFATCPPRPSRVIVPIGLAKNRDKSVIEIKTGTTPYKLHYKAHGVELAFSLTYHKLQGVTVPKIVLDLSGGIGNENNLDFAGFYVGTTRVKNSTHIRALPLQGGAFGALGFKHLLKLKPDCRLRQWAAGFQPDGIWNRQLANRQQGGGGGATGRGSRGGRGTGSTRGRGTGSRGGRGTSTGSRGGRGRGSTGGRGRGSRGRGSSRG